MDHPPWRLLAAALLAGGLVLGCKARPVVQQKQPPDPLLVSKKPLEGRPQDAPEAAVRVDPLPPPPPGRERPYAAPPRIDLAADRPEARLGPPMR
jgi:hypothetical protein